MPPDPIRRAVEVAAEALQENMTRWHGACPEDYEAVDHAERIVAAFLRALPDDAAVWAPDKTGRPRPWIGISYLAAAVLAAGKGERYGN